MEDTILRRTWAEIDLDALGHNYTMARQRTGPGVKYLGVVKADAYGHGAVQIARKLEALGADYLAVSSLDEARELRHGGIAMPILILGHTPPEMVAELIRYGITQTVSAQAKAEEYSAEAGRCGGKLKVHIKVDTGMSRLGFLVRGGHVDGGVEAIARSCALPHLEAEGIFTHFAASDVGDPASEAYTREQFGVFTSVLDALEAKGRTFAIRHCANSGALARYPEMYLDMVRPGIALYGVGDDAKALGLRPVMTLKSCISTIKVFDPDTDISYGRTFHTAGKTRVGVLPIGYADGLFRGLSNHMAVQTADGPAPILGRICMDMTMVDLSALPNIHVGDAVELFGKQQLVDDLARILDTIPYELTCSVSKRVPRLYLEHGETVERSLRLL
ncbi:alanine racemase [Oscillibacter sp.]|uniref:alanine racemase n=1 Tax=Oscillibacter sp. TaxID=1945593 RepID=UPI0026169D7F|nr:alanine racemase [Oscillibacter sp.]MDD3346232.1 alanine racemase [Oscillibacter sp.]